MAVYQEGEWFINSNAASSRDGAAMQHITGHNVMLEARNLLTENDVKAIQPA